MSTIVYQKNKKTGITYAYESTSYWDKEKSQPRSKRKYLGRVDPETGEIVRKEKAAGKNKDDDGTVAALRKELEEKERTIEALQKDLSSLQEKYMEANRTIAAIARIAHPQE
jgi:predicted RNase H-like nuclease (RuvC/YqgF family)